MTEIVDVIQLRIGDITDAGPVRDIALYNRRSIVYFDAGSLDLAWRDKVRIYR